MIEEIRTTLEWTILFITIFGYYVTFVHFKWWNLYKPSPLIRHLLISSIAVDFSASMLSIIVISDFFDIDLPSGVGLLLLGLAMIISLSVKGYRRIDLHNLDNPNEDISQRVETQDQREDRQFGEERRNLEEEHAQEQAVVAEAAVDAGYAEGVEAGRKEETSKQSEDREFGDRRRILERIHSDEDE